MKQLFLLLRSRLARFVQQMAHLPRVLGLIWRASGWWTVLWAALLLLQGVLPAGLLYLTRQLVNSLVDGLAAASSDSQVWLSAVLVAATLLAMEILRAVTGLVRTIQSERLNDFLADLVHRQSSRLDLAFYDWPEFHDHLHRARAESSYRPLALLDSLGGLLQYGVTLLGFTVVLLPYGWWVSGLLVASTLPALLVVLHYGYQHHLWHRQRTGQERRCWYLDWLLTSRETAAELRLFQLGDHFREAYQQIRGELRRGNVRLSRRQAVAQLAAGLVAIAVTGAMMVWMLWRVQRGVARLGDLVLFYQAFRQGQHMMDSLLQQVGQLYYNSLFLGNLFEFLDLQPTIVDPVEPVTLSTAADHASRGDGLRCLGITFRYPGSERAALRDFDLHVPEGQFVALVGPNGAGKSTLVKLLCRLYDPQQGRITFNGVELHDLRQDEYRRITSVLFQQPVQYNATVTENLTLGDLERRGDRRAIQQAAEAAGADSFIRDLPLAYEQLLGKWFEAGAELSVGQWQRLALARAYLRQTRILILDEPTSAMDPWAELEWLERFRELGSGRTSIIITHRFTTARHADIIHVLSDGRIVESGGHRQLLAAGGLYARSWKRQMRKAVPNETSELDSRIV
jgi:ATP-binding cassette subfamily B protein